MIRGIEKAEATFVYYATMINGGYTYRPDCPTPRTGFLVGGVVMSQVLLPEEFTADAVARFSEVHKGTLALPGMYLGTWKAPDGRVHLDVTQHWLARRYAERCGRAWRQVSIWDCAGKAEIQL